MVSRVNLLNGLLNQECYETVDIYQPREGDFYQQIAAKLPQGFALVRKTIWFNCTSRSNVVPLQGWKIHVSATLSDARETLGRVASVLFRRCDADFKFALDLPVLSLLNGKNWPRGGSGKFITIYPRDDAHFLELMEELHQATDGQCGPYILSDRRYKDKGVVFYRYGGMRSHSRLNVKGERSFLLTGPDGAVIPDQRAAFPTTPPWAKCPLQIGETAESSSDVTCVGDGRYQITGALAFSNAGGVYRALDRKTGKHVVVKEARPHVSVSPKGCDVVDLLKKEYRLLRLVANSGIAPQPYDFFQEWEHWFLVEEFIEGVSLASYASANSILLRTRPSSGDVDEWYASFRRLFQAMVRIIDLLHQANIVFGDLSPNNILVTDDLSQLKLIDFEGAQQIGVDAPVSLYTPGFASPDRLRGAQATFEDDYYALGAILCSCLFPLSGLVSLRPEASQHIVRSIQNDTQMPSSVAMLIRDLLSEKPAQRPVPKKIYGILATAQARDCRTHLDKEEPADYSTVIDEIDRHIRTSASYLRKDRLFPADAKLFSTNPLSLAHGAAGVVFALSRISDEFPQHALEWILQHEVTNDEYPPGLYLGLSGIAWCLLDVGFRSEAERMFQRTLCHPLLDETADIFYGLAGWGMTCLHFFMATQDEVYLDHAKRAGTRILETSTCDDRGRYWMSSQELRLGFAHGASGVALFLLYLYLVTGDSTFLIAGREALEFDLGFAVETRDQGLAWSHSADSRSPLYPYWRFGSAGIGRVVLRFYRLLGNEEYREVLEKAFIETDRKYAVFPNQFMGLAGLGEFALDLYDYFGEERFLDGARKAARGIMLFRIDRTGIAFPGDQLARLSCDFGTGSAGIALFLQRLMRRQGSHFMLDSLFDVCRVPAAADLACR